MATMTATKTLKRNFFCCFVLVCALLLPGCVRPAPRPAIPSTDQAPQFTAVAPARTLPPNPSPTKSAASPPTATLEPSRPAPSATPGPTATAAPPTLRSLAEGHGLSIGSAVAPQWFDSDPAYTALLVEQLNLLTPENSMKWPIIHPQPERYDFTEGDAVVAFAEANGMQVRGHTLAWGNMLPDWVQQAYTDGRYTKEQWKEILRQHIQSVVGHYRGIVYAWDVVNEAIADDGSFVDNLWLRAIGPEYVALALRWAHEADPQALLFYNDHGGEGLNAKSNAIYALVQGLLAAGVPIDGVGLQMHVWLDGPPAPGELAANMQRLSDLGLQVQITEMDVRTQYSQASADEKLAAQAEIYRRALSTCLAAQNCTAFSTWGLSDRYSWIPGFTGNPDVPLPFDEAYLPKPAYHALLEALSGSP